MQTGAIFRSNFIGELATSFEATLAPLVGYQSCYQRNTSGAAVKYSSKYGKSPIKKTALMAVFFIGLKD